MTTLNIVSRYTVNKICKDDPIEFNLVKDKNK